MDMQYTDGERYYSFPAYCRNTFGHKLYKVPLDAGMTCPNRDGTLGRRGCIFCDEGGSGDFALAYHGQPIRREMLKGERYPKELTGLCIGYFQAYTNTYAPVETLDCLFRAALQEPLFAGISIATRPDCLPDEVMELLRQLKADYPDKFIWVELGLQSIHERSARWMRRGYELPVFDDCVRRLRELEIPVIVHVILGLPQETEEDMLATVAHLNRCGAAGVKLQLLHYLRGTDLGEMYLRGEVQALSEDEYIRILGSCIAALDPGVVIHRLTGDGPGDLLLAPLWSRDKKRVLNRLRADLRERKITQGCRGLL
ncbi:MAG: TIGR01212 family radical SAM protein [Solobacterium sp.]|nr:TIGR01212 family radical SAM protein [Solobacterium sp.]